jgi:hypothetical protein
MFHEVPQCLRYGTPKARFNQQSNNCPERTLGLQIDGRPLGVVKLLKLLQETNTQNRLASTIPCMYQGCKERHSCSGMSLHLSPGITTNNFFNKIIIIHFYQNLFFGSNLPLLNVCQCFLALANVPSHFPKATQWLFSA